MTRSPPTIWNLSENSSNLVQPPIPNTFDTVYTVNAIHTALHCCYDYYQSTYGTKNGEEKPGKYRENISSEEEN